MDKIELIPPILKHRYRVIYADTDAAGVVYYGNYLRFFEIGRTEFLRELTDISYKEIEDSGILLPVTESYCRYKASARYDDLLEISTSLIKFSKVSISFAHEIRKLDNNQLLVTGYTKHASINREGKISSLPSFVLDKLRERIG